MNYIKQLNTFYRLLPDNPLSPNAQCLYNYLLNKCSELGWKSEFRVANSILMGFTGLNMSALQRARNSLVQNGYIKYNKGNNQYQAGTYEIVEFEQVGEQACEQAYEQANEQASEQANERASEQANEHIK